MSHLTEDRIHELAGGNTDGASLAHLAACMRCRSEVEELRHVLVSVQALPRGIRPERDLLAGIHQRIALLHQDVTPITAGRGRVATVRKAIDAWRTSVRWQLAAAAVLLVITTSVITRALSNGAQSNENPEQGGSAWLVGRETRVLEERYQRAITELEQLVDAQRAALAPATLQLLEQNLRVIDRAIHESRAALEHDPNSELIHELLRSVYQRKLELLRSAAGT